METEKDWAYTVKEFCKLAKLSRREFYYEIKRKKLQARKRGSRTLVLRQDAVAYLASLPLIGERAA